MMVLTIKEIQALETEMLKEVIDICNNNEIEYYLAYGSTLGAIRHGGTIPWDDDVDIVIPYNQLNKFISITRQKLSNKFFVDYYDINKYYTLTFPRIGLKGYSTLYLHVDVFFFLGLPDERKKQLKIMKTLDRLKKHNTTKTITTKYNKKKESLFRLSIRAFAKLLYTPYTLNKIRKQIDDMCTKYPIETANFVGVHNTAWRKAPTPKEFYGKGVIKNYEGFEVKIPEQYDAYLRHFYNDYMQLPPEQERNNINNLYTIDKIEF
ncbi:lipopolysaccharide cholinephosphotransferase [Dysgonomonadaceae bacterium PH5-43]|nr:lipopolysaccharide cholinephosphotransferase [Dysgonomonadaceae bacterium PH5-43]